jgi:hypothetical protein
MTTASMPPSFSLIPPAANRHNESASSGTFSSNTVQEEGDYHHRRPTHSPQQHPNFAYTWISASRRSSRQNRRSPLPPVSTKSSLRRRLPRSHAKLEFSNPQITGKVLAVSGAPRAQLTIPAMSGAQSVTVVTYRSLQPAQFLVENLR